MRTYKNTTAQILDDVICDMCKKSCGTALGGKAFMTIKASWGYASKRDGMDWRGEYCEECSGKIKEYIRDMGGSIPEDVRPLL